MGYSKEKLLLGSSSSGTSPSIFVGDARLLSISIQSSTGSASNITISLSNAPGFAAAIPDGQWSVVTVIPVRGIFSVDPGARWLRAERANIAISAASVTTVMLNRYYE